MRFRYIFGSVVGLLALLLGASVKAETGDSVIRRTPPSAYEGRHFLVGFMQNENYILQGGLHLQIFIASSRATRVQVFPPGSRIAQVINLPKDTIITIEPQQAENVKYESFESELAQYKLTEIVADQPITVYAMSAQAQTTDSYSVLPITEWERNYVILSMPNDKYTDDPEADPELLENRQSEFLVMAAYDNTLVVISPSTKTERGYKRGETASVTLNKGQCYLVKSHPLLPSGDGDLSGTLINSDKPIGVLAGHARASVPPLQYQRGEDNSKDHLCDMLLPVQKWDSEYVSVPFDVLSAQGDYFKITAATPNTIVKYSGPGFSGSFNLVNPGDTASLDGVNTPLLWTANNKFSIAQFMETSFNRREEFDPAMVILPPRNRFVSRALFQVLPNPSYNPQKFHYHFVGLVVDATALRNITLDGVNVASINPNILTQIIPSRNLYWVNLSITPGKHELKSEYGKFSGVIYGVGLNDSYAMTLGISFDNPDADTLPPIVKYKNDCGVLTGEAIDAVSPEMSGIFSATVVQNFNFTFTASSILDTTRFLNFTAKPTDPAKDGFIVIDVRDKSGNGRIIWHSYSAVKIAVEKSVSYGAVNWRDSVCRTIVIRNVGNSTIQISDVALAGDNRLKFTPDISSALKNRSLAAGDTIALNICFYPDGDSVALAAFCKINLPCNLSLDIPITALVVAPGFIAEGWDFGDVLVGDTACAVIKVRNTGNVKMLITKLILSPSNDFIFKVGGILPDTLAPNDSLMIPVCFTPSARSDYAFAGFAADQTNNKQSFAVTGRGIAPLVSASSINWGKRRAGTYNDSLYWLKNNGNTSATVYYDHISGDASAFATLAGGVIGFEIMPNDSIQIIASFVPPDNDLRAFNATEYFRVQNWRLHPPTAANLSGAGTMPAIQTFDTDFGSVQVNKTLDSTVICAASDGDEDLAIDSIYAVSGDYDSFIIPEGELSLKRVLPVGSGVSLLVKFAPARVGAHSAVYAVVHDGAPNYKRVTSYFKFNGNATPDDTLRGELHLSPPQIGVTPACVGRPVNMTLKNTGNRTLVIDSFYAAVFSQQVQIKILSQPQLPYSLRRGDSVTGAYIFTPSGNSTFNAVFRVTTTNGVAFEENRSFSSKLNNMSASISFDNLPAAPGKSGAVELAGDIEAVDSMRILPEAVLTLPAKMAVINTTEAICRFIENGVSRNIPVAVLQGEAETRILFSTPISIANNAQWSITLPYMLMLSDQMKTTAIINFHDKLGGCYADASAQTTLDVTPVCAQSIRVVKAMSGVFMLLGISPTPAADNITARYIAPERTEVEFDAVNSLGISISLGRKYLAAESGEIALDVSSLPPGVYRIIGRTSNYGSANAPIMIISR